MKKKTWHSSSSVLTFIRKPDRVFVGLNLQCIWMYVEMGTRLIDNTDLKSFSSSQGDQNAKRSNISNRYACALHSCSLFITDSRCCNLSLVSSLNKFSLHITILSAWISTLKSYELQNMAGNMHVSASTDLFMCIFYGTKTEQKLFFCSLIRQPEYKVSLKS